MHVARLGEHYFKDPPSQLPPNFLNSLRNLLASYDPQSFWSFIRNELKEIKNVGALYWILTKLTNQPKVREFTSPNYEFLLLGRMEEKLLQQLQEPKMEELCFQLLHLVQLIGKEELPEYLILQNYFAETPSLTFNTLLNSFKDIVMRDKVNAYMQDTKDFSPASILSKEHLKKILNFIMPVNISCLQFFVQQYLKRQNFSKVVNDDVILFKGVTGCGKSTMILYLLGYKIKLKRDSQGLWQTVPEGQVDVQHRQIISKSSIHSVTNTCHLVKLLNPAQPKPVYFMDSPGSEDSRSINRIILNYLIMKKTYSLSPKIKFVEVINTAQLNQQRINGLKKFTQYIVDSYNFSSIHELRDILTVLFNKCSCNYDNIKEVLKSIQQCLYEQKYENEFDAKQKIALKFLLDAWNENEEYEDCPVAIPIDFHCKQYKRELLLQHLMQTQACQNPSQVTKNTLKGQYMEKIHSTLQYLVSSVRSWLDERRYDMVYYYCQQFWFLASHFESQQPSIGLRCLQVPNFITEHFQRQLEAFRNLLRLNRSLVFNDDAMQTIKTCYSSIKQAEIMKDQSWFNYTSFIGKLNSIKQQLLSSYQTALRQGSVDPQIVQNYKKFAQIFQQQVNLLLPMLATKSQLEQGIISIIQSQSNYNNIDELYLRLKQVRENILSLNPSQPLQNKVETAFIDMISLKYGALQREFDQQIEKISRQRLFETKPVEPTELLSAIQEYQSLNHSTTLQEMKADKNQVVLLQQLAQKLIVIIQQFRDEKSLSREIVDNFNTFISHYSQFPTLEQVMLPHIADLAKIFKTKRNSINQEYSKIMQKCKRVLIDPNEDIETNAIRLSDGLKLCEIYSYYLGEDFNKYKLQLNLIQLIQQLVIEYESRNIIIFRIKQETRKFPILVKRRDKIQIILSYLPNLLPLFENYHQACKIFVLNFVKCIQMAIQENTRLNKFVTQIRQKQLFNYFQTIQEVLPAIQRLGHSQVCSELIAKAYSEVFDNCNNLADSAITYNLTFKMYEHDAERQVYIKDLIHLFKFLFKLPENAYFANRYKEIDLKEKIIKKLMTELKQIGSEILHNQKMARQYYENVKIKLYPFQLLENMPLKNGPIDEQIRQVITKLQDVHKQADKRNPSTHDQPGFQIIYNLGLGYNFGKFKKIFDSGLYKRSAKDIAFIIFEEYLCRFIEKMDEKSLNNTQDYDTLKVIKQLLQSKDKKISALNNILIKIEDDFVAGITESYQKAESMHLAGDYKKSVLELTKLQQIRVKCMQKERQIRQKIKDLKQAITTKLNGMEQFKESLQRNISINIYDNYDRIMHLLQMSNQDSFQQRIVSLIFNEMDQLKKIRKDSPDLESFKDKSMKISSIISMLHGHNRQVLTSQLDLIKKKLNDALTVAIENAPSLSNNYGELMKLMFKQSIIGSNSDRLVDQRKILFIKIQQELSNDKLKLQDRFGVLKRSFWVQDIASNVLNTYKTINEQREKIYMDSIRARSIDREVQKIQENIGNPNVNTVIRQKNVEKSSSVMYFRELKKHKHLFYNRDLFNHNRQKYCERFENIRSRMEASSQERNTNFDVSRNCRIIGKIIETISVLAQQPSPPDHQKAAPQ